MSEDEEKLVLSSSDLPRLQQAVERLRMEGAEEVTDPVQVGSVWQATCQHPDFTCSVEKLGSKIVISGPTLELVRAKAINFLIMGSVLVGDPEQVGGRWVANLEDAAREEKQE